MKRIVVGVDGSEGAQRALRWAIDEARLHGARVTVANVWSIVIAGGGLPFGAPSVSVEAFEEAAKRTAESAIQALPTNDVEVEAKVICGSVVGSLLSEAEGADLLVVGSRGLGGFRELLLGSVSHQVAQHASCPVVIVPTPKDH